MLRSCCRPLRYQFYQNFLRNCSNVSEQSVETKKSLSTKIIEYFRRIFDDYKAVVVETVQDACDRPLKAAFIACSLAGALSVARLRPSFEDYNAQLVTSAVAVENLSESIRSPVTFEYLRRVKELHSCGCLRYLNLGLVALIWRHDNPSYLCTYEAVCPHLRPDWRNFLQTRIVDVGVAGHWLDLEACMKDYDVNPTEWNETDTHQFYFVDNLKATYNPGER